VNTAARRPVIGVMGAAAASPPHVADARRLGKLIAQAGWILLTGGRPVGVMEAATAGAKEVPGALTVGILPGSDDEAAEGVDIAIVTGMGDARNAINVLSSSAIVACGVEGAGTASEVSLALKAGVPVVLLRPHKNARALFRALGPSLVHEARTPDAAIRVLMERVGIAPGPVWPS
jgi:uncharacterized protein (TIGR00725 family)